MDAPALAAIGRLESCERRVEHLGQAAPGGKGVAVAEETLLGTSRDKGDSVETLKSACAGQGAPTRPTAAARVGSTPLHLGQNKADKLGFLRIMC